MTQSTIMRHHSLKEWLIAVRPWSFPASTMPVIITYCYLLWNGKQPNLGLSLWALVAIILFHAAGNTWSDYFDYKKGVDKEDTYGVKTLTNGMFSPQEIMRLSLGLLAVSIIAGMGLLSCTRWSLLWIGLGGFVGTVFYPYLKFHALGDVDIFLCYAVLPSLGTSYVATGTFHLDTFYAVLPVGLITVAILHVNNTRDCDTDKRAGINTLSLCVGKRVSIAIYEMELLLPFLATTVFLAVCSTLPLLCSLVWIAFPIALSNIRTMRKYLHEGYTVIGHLDEKTAALQLTYSLLLSLGLLISTFL